MAQIGTIKIQTQNGERTVPVFDLGDSGSNIYEYLRVRTPSGTGFIPLASLNDAAFSEIRTETQSGILAIHDSSSTISSKTDSFEHSGASDGSSITSNSDWTTVDYDVNYDSGYSSDGSFSAFKNAFPNNGPLIKKDFFSSETQISKFKFSYRETGNSTGQAVSLRDASGNRILAIGTANPQIMVYDNSGFNDESGSCNSNYDTWYTVTITFDWGAGTFSYDRSDGCSLGPYNLRNTNGVMSVYLENFNGPNDGWSSSSDIDGWWDDIQLIY
jgi:hypothetical protein